MTATVHASSDRALIDAADAARVGRLLSSSRAPETKRSYAAAIKVFSGWCHERGYSAFPADPVIVAAYIAWRGECVAHVTVARDLAAISATHLDSGLEDPTRHHGVRQALRAVARERGVSPARRAAPVTTEILRRILSAMDDREELTGRRDAAIMLLGLAAAMRRGELASARPSDLALRENGLLLRISRSKTDQLGAGEVVGIPYGEHPDTCPVLAVLAWLEVSDRHIGDDTPLFSRIYNRRSVGNQPLSGRSVARIIQARAEAASVQGDEYQSMSAGDTWISGHSLRAGHATSAAEAGVDVSRIARTTRHKRLESLAKYVRPLSAVDDSTAGQIGL